MRQAQKLLYFISNIFFNQKFDGGSVFFLFMRFFRNSFKDVDSSFYIEWYARQRASLIVVSFFANPDRVHQNKSVFLGVLRINLTSSSFANRVRHGVRQYLVEYFWHFRFGIRTDNTGLVVLVVDSLLFHYLTKKFDV